MSMAGIAPMDRSTKCIIVEAAVTKTRAFTKNSLDHMPDAHIRRLLDEAIDRAGEEDRELWWEDDHAYGIMPNTVIKVDQAFEGADRVFYAITRPAFNPSFDGQMIMITVVDEAERKISIRSSRWVEKKPEGPRVGSLQYKALESIKDHVVELAVAPVQKEEEPMDVEVQHPQPFLIKAGDYEYREPDLDAVKKKVMELILLEDHPIKEISVFKQVPIGINVNLGEED